jgi:hypothetical protein
MQVTICWSYALTAAAVVSVPLTSLHFEGGMTGAL